MEAKAQPPKDSKGKTAKTQPLGSTSEERDFKLLNSFVGGGRKGASMKPLNEPIREEEENDNDRD